MKPPPDLMAAPPLRGAQYDRNDIEIDQGEIEKISI